MASEQKLVEVPPEEEFLSVFDRIDYNGDGILSLSELVKAVDEIWPKSIRKPAIIRAFKAADLNGDGVIKRDEFKMLLYFLSEYTRMFRIFASADVNDDHQLTLEEFKAAAPHLEIQNAEDLFYHMDPKNRGYVLFDEFCVWMAVKKSGRRKNDMRSSRVLVTAISMEHEQTHITRAIIELKCSMDLLEATASDEQIESWAILIHGCMQTGARDYHSLQRIFDITDGADPIQMIAAFFHDTVYYEVDQGLSPKLAEILHGVLDEEHEYQISPAILEEYDPNVAMVLCIFGFTPGQMCHPKLGLNRFLSAVLATRLLKGTLPMGLLARIVVCIRATVAFRKTVSFQKRDDGHLHAEVVHKATESMVGEASPDGTFGQFEIRGPAPDHLYERLVKTNETFQLGLSETEIVKAIRRAADSSNRSFAIFTSNDPKLFLDRLWSLLPEITPALRSRKLCTLSDYHKGVKNLEMMMGTLDPADIIISFRDVPPPSEMAKSHEMIRHNIGFAKKYTQVKTVTLALVTAFAELTGGSKSPKSFFVGDSPSLHHHSDHVGDDLPDLVFEDLAECDKVVYEMMKSGRKTDSSFDISNSPVAAFLYGVVGDAGIQRALKFTDHPMEMDRAKALLSSLPLEVVIPVGQGIAKIAISRTERIEELLKTMMQQRRVVTP